MTTVYWYACLRFAPLYFLSLIVSVAIFFYVINHYESPELKLPWLVIILAFGIVGALIFLLLTSNERFKKTLHKFQASVSKTAKFLPKNTLTLIPKTDQTAYGQAHYLVGASGFAAYAGNQTTYFATGEDFWQALLADLEKAQDFILLEFFIIEPGEMWGSIAEILRRKVEEGVEIYLMYDDFGCMNRLPIGFERAMQNIGIHTLIANQIQPVLSRAYNNRDHRKIVVIDNQISYTGGANLADEYINKHERFGYWKDSAIRIVGTAATSFTAMFLELWNGQSAVTLDEKRFFVKTTAKSHQTKTTPSVVIPYGDGPHAFYPEENAKDVYLNLINAARDYLYITTPYLICEYELMDALVLAAKRGVDVRIIVPHIPDKKIIFWMTRSNYEILIRSGVKVYEFTPGFIHAKNFVCDDKVATCGTVNLDYRSLVHHFECGVWLYQDTSIKQMKKDFLATIKQSALVTSGEAHLDLWQRLMAEILKIFSSLM